MNRKGFVAPSATLHGKDIRLGPNIFVDEHAVLFQQDGGGSIQIGAETRISRGTVIETLNGGSITVGEKSLVQPHCFLSAAKGSIVIGADVQLAPYCAFYPHDHGMVPGMAISTQPLVVKGDIVVGDGAWVGHGTIVLSGVKIGKGAVIGAGSVVTHDIPENGIAYGVPAKVFSERKDTAEAHRSLKESLASAESNTGKRAR